MDNFENDVFDNEGNGEIGESNDNIVAGNGGEPITEGEVHAADEQAGNENQPNQQEPEGNIVSESKSKKPLFIIIGLLVVAAIASAAVFFFSNTPEKVMAKARKASMSDYGQVMGNAMFSKDRVYVELTPETELDFSCTLKSISSMSGLPLLFLNGANVSGSIITDENTKNLDAGIQISLKDEVIAGMNFNLDDSYISFNIPELTGDRYISAELKNLNEDFYNSPFVGMMEVPEYDYASVAEKVFSVTSRINEMNSAYADADIADGLAVVNELDGALVKGTSGRLDIKKGEPGEVNSVKCRTFETGFQADAVQKAFRERAYAFAEGFDEEINNSISKMGESMPGFNRDYYGELLELGQNLRDEIDKVVFEEPLKIVYYVDGKNKIRRSVYSTIIKYDDKNWDFGFEIIKNGESNIFDSVDMRLDLSSQAGAVSVEWLSDGDHANKDVFTDKSWIKISYTDSENGISNAFTIKNTLNYEAADNRTKLDTEVSMDSSPGTLAFGYDMTSETDKEKKVSKTTFNDIYFELPGVKLSFATSYGVSPSTDKPKSSEQLQSVEILKLNPFELAELSSEVNANYEELARKVIGLFGDFGY